MWLLSFQSGAISLSPAASGPVAGMLCWLSIGHGMRWPLSQWTCTLSPGPSFAPHPSFLLADELVLSPFLVWCGAGGWEGWTWKWYGGLWGVKWPSCIPKGTSAALSCLDIEGCQGRNAEMLLGCLLGSRGCIASVGELWLCFCCLECSTSLFLFPCHLPPQMQSGILMSAVLAWQRLWLLVQFFRCFFFIGCLH